MIDSSSLSHFILLVKFNWLSSSNQTIFYLFWPIFRNLAPVASAYLVFGKILEQNSGEIPYHIWVLSGASFWVVFSGSISIAANLFSSNIRRKRFHLGNISPKNVMKSIHFLPQVIAFLLTVPCLIYTLSNFHGTESIVRLILVLVFLIFFANIMIYVSFHVAILCAFLRDFRYILPWMSQLILLISPIFYLPRESNSITEHILETINPINYVLEINRFLLFGESIESTLRIYMFLSLAIVYCVLSSFKLNSLLMKFLFVMTADNYFEEEEKPSA